MLNIQNLVVEVNGRKILNGLTLRVRPGEVHAIMGPNGSGKSTFSKVIAGYPGYQKISGQLEYEVNGEYRDLSAMEPDVRAKEGVFMAFQYPVEVPGVSNLDFLRESFNAICKHQGAPALGEEAFRKYVADKARLVELDPRFLERNVNEGFSGGEKKRNEILQMAVLAPRLAILDETDSGLDIDALRVVSRGVNNLRSPDRAMILITHYQRILDYIVPDYVHVLVGGKIVRSGGKELAHQLEKEGYSAFL